MSLRNALLAAFLVALAPAARAQEPAPSTPEGDATGWHTVKSGETLEGITAHYLGSPRFWRENHRLNPQLADPHRLRPGERIRVVVARRLPPRTAKIELLEKRVDDKPEPMPWTPARAGDLLKERDGVRTFALSSARLAFDDGSRLVLTEDSLVFLRRMEAVPASRIGERGQAIEILEGRADLEARPPRGARPSRIEILMGGTVARPVPGPSGVAQARARKKKEGEALVMVFEGRSDVASAGSTVEVPRGMGTRVPPGEPPKPPEKLLPAPRLAGPADGESLSFANPRLSWEAVPGAPSYTVELCRDEACGALVASAPRVEATEWTPDALPAGQLFWRVTATAGSGLDGYPSAPRALEIASDRVDREPPAVVAWLRGSGSVAVSGDVEVGESGVLLLDARDDLSGIASVRYRWNRGAWEVDGGRGLRPPEPGRPALLEFQAFDRAGLGSPVLSATVVAAPSGAGAP